MLESYPPRSPGVIAGILLILALLLLDLILLLYLLTQSISLWSFLGGIVLLATIPVLVLVGYLTRSLPQACYHIESDALIIEWGGLIQTIPLAHIRALLWGRDLGQVRHFRGLRWPGFYIGQGEIMYRQRVYPIRFYATRPPAQQLLLVTDNLTYAVSPWDMENFKACVEALQATILSPRATTSDVGAQDAHAVGERDAHSRQDGLRSRTPTSPSQPFVLDWPIWQDQTAHLLLLLPTFVNLLLFAYLTIIYSRLPTPLAIQFDAAGQALRLRQPLILFTLPLAGLAAILGNSVAGWLFYQWRREKALAYLIWAASLVVQIAIWVAVLGLTGF